MSDILVYDNFLDQSDFNLIKNTILSRNFPWYYQDTVVNNNIEEQRDIDSYQFVHLFFNGFCCSEYYNILKPLIKKLNIKTLLKIKSNLLTKNNDPKVFPLHKDYVYPTAKTAIYYVNTNNGMTIFQGGKTVSSIENRVVVFDNNLMHTGKTCSDNSVRVLINLNYFDY